MSNFDTTTEIRKYVFKEYDGSMPVIGLDLDEVLWAVMPSYLTELSAITGQTYLMENFHEYNMCRSLGVSEKLVHHVLNNTDAFCNVDPYTYSESLVRMLREGVITPSYGLASEPHYIAFITHRGFRPDGFIKTFDLLKSFGILPDALIAAPMAQSKLDVMDELYQDNIVLIFEDCPKNIDEFVSASIPVAKHIQPWNKNVWADYTIDLNKQAMPL